jgi:hypothetical protein
VAGGRWQEAGGRSRRQEAGGRRQEQEAGAGSRAVSRKQHVSRAPVTHANLSPAPASCSFIFLYYKRVPRKSTTATLK